MTRCTKKTEALYYKQIHNPRLMPSNITRAGVSTPMLLGAVTAILIAAGVTYYLMSSTAPEAIAPAAIPTSSPAGTTPPPTASPAQPTAPSAIHYTGTVLAGTSAPLLEFNPTDFAAAQEANKVIVLYFYANWCPECRAEFPKMEQAFNTLDTNQVVGFRVNFNDNQTGNAEVALAREHGIAYQHTKVIIKNGQQLLKSPETWEQDRYPREINQALAP